MQFYLCKVLYLILAAYFSVLPLSLKPGDTRVTQSRIDLNNFFNHLVQNSKKINTKIYTAHERTGGRVS